MKQNLFGIATAILIAGAVSLFTARRIEAQYASPVKVMNSTSGPAIASGMDGTGRVPYQSVLELTTCAGLNVCSFNFPVVPAGHRLRITQISGTHFLNTPYAGPLVYSVGMYVKTGSVVDFQFLWNPTVRATAVDSIYLYPVTAYLDPGDHIQVFSSLMGTTFLSGTTPQIAVLSGYMLDCAAAPCSAIAH